MQPNAKAAPGGDARFLIESDATVGDPPLIVVDGVILRPGTRLQDTGVAPDHILEIEVIKGAAAATLYGSRAEHGVILITTTQGAARSPADRPTTAPRPDPRPVSRMEVRPPPGGASAADHAGVPLHVVDGVMVSEAVFRRISPDDIEVIEILKGAAAERLYGARAAAGVIVVTTRQ
jgi:TonB-dependent SusC/RagA subfamily outer membrane receptor